MKANFVYFLKIIIKKNSDTMSSYLVKPFPDTQSMLLYKIFVHFTKAILNSVFQFCSGFGGPVVLINICF